MINKYKNPLLLNMLSILLLSCSSGTTNNTTSPTPPQGPVSYDYNQQMFSKGKSLSKANSSVLSVSGGSCATFNDMFESSIEVQPLQFSFAFMLLGTPELKAQMIPGSNSACATNTVPETSLAAVAQNVQVQGVAGYMNLLNNNFYQSQSGIADYAAYQLDISNIIGYQTSSSVEYGLLGEYLYTIGSWEYPYGPQVQPINVSMISESNTLMVNTQMMVNGYVNQPISQLSRVSDLFGATYNPNSCPGSATQPNCYMTVTQANSSSKLLTLYSNLESQFVAYNQSMLAESNIIPNFDQYNDTLASIYMEGIAALQSLYFIEYTNNQLNYNNGVAVQYNGIQNTNYLLAQISSLSGVPGTNYQYQWILSGSNDTIDPALAAKNQMLNATNYNNAQEQLTQFYSALINQLYINTAQYMVTDQPLGSQTWPLNESSIQIDSFTIKTNTNNMYDSFTVNSFAPKTFYQSAYATVPQPYFESNIMFYQYQGISNASQCYQNMMNWLLDPSSITTMSNAMNEVDCGIAISTPGNSSVYNGSILTSNINVSPVQPYAAFSSTQNPTLSQLAPTAYAPYCESFEYLIATTPNGSQMVLSCLYPTQLPGLNGSLFGTGGSGSAGGDYAGTWINSLELFQTEHTQTKSSSTWNYGGLQVSFINSSALAGNITPPLPTNCGYVPSNSIYGSNWADCSGDGQFAGIVGYAIQNYTMPSNFPSIPNNFNCEGPTLLSPISWSAWKENDSYGEPSPASYLACSAYGYAYFNQLNNTSQSPTFFSPNPAYSGNEDNGVYTWSSEAFQLPDGTWIPLQFVLASTVDGLVSLSVHYNSNASLINNGYSCSFSGGALQCATSLGYVWNINYSLIGANSINFYQINIAATLAQ